MAERREDEEIACREFVEVITDYLEGALSDGEARALEEHLQTCPGCETYLAQMRETIARMGSLPREELSDATRGVLRDAFRSWSSRRE
ncbi:anti-sigma factor [Paraconexibacter sp.]|uniref:anti-sigma factor family protein n=1 Tax=Paraconexibacter sp. TaxID=2949640 RepID=UPI003563E854